MAKNEFKLLTSINDSYTRPFYPIFSKKFRITLIRKSHMKSFGLILLGIVFYPMLAFGDAKYQGAPS